MLTDGVSIAAFIEHSVCYSRDRNSINEENGAARSHSVAAATSTVVARFPIQIVRRSRYQPSDVGY